MTYLRRQSSSSQSTESTVSVKSSGFWSFARLLLAGTVGFGALSLLATLAGSAWLTANQRSEAEKPAPWADPSFTTTAITTGGLISRWTDNDGNPDNGHSYIRGIYDIWLVRHTSDDWRPAFGSPDKLSRVPEAWRHVVTADIESYSQSIHKNAQIYIQERFQRRNDAASKVK